MIMSGANFCDDSFFGGADGRGALVPQPQRSGLIG